MTKIEPKTKVHLTVTPPGTSLWDHLKDKEGVATEHISESGNQQFLFDGSKAIWANGGNGFLCEPINT